MSFSVVLAASLSLLALLSSLINQVIEALGVLGHPGGGDVAMRVLLAPGVSVMLGALLRPPSILARRGTLVDQEEKLNYLRHCMRQTRGRVVPPG
jgi:hypothetical protein